MTSLTDAVDFWGRWTPNAEALVHGGVRFTWADVASRTGRLAAGFHHAGVRRGDRIALVARNDVRWYDTVLAGLRLGAVIVPVNLRVSPDPAAAMVLDAQCGLVVVDSERYDHLAAVVPAEKMWCIDAPWGGRARFDSLYTDTALPSAAVSARDPAVIAYTSGTTGTPKGAVLTHEGLLGLARALSTSLCWSRFTRFLHLGSLSYTAGVTQAILAVASVGGTLVVEHDFSVDLLVHLLEYERITAWHGLAVHWDALRRSHAGSTRSFPLLTSAITGGGSIPAEVFTDIGALGIPLRHVYGMTEAGGTIAMATDASRATAPMSVGRPLMHADVRVVGDDGVGLVPGEVGQLLVRTAAMMSGYWRRPTESAAMTVDGWLRTGDVGQIDDGGLIYVTDRRGNGIARGSHIVYPAELERAALGVHGVLEAVALGVDCGVTLVCRLDGISADTLRSVLAARLPAEGCPTRIVAVTAELPRSQTGKVLRHEVAALLAP